MSGQLCSVLGAIRRDLRGRMRSTGVLDDAEAKQYADPSLPPPLLVAFVLGALADQAAPLPSEAQVEAEVAARLAPVPPAAPEPRRAKSAPWIGDPLPSAGR